MLHTGIAWEHLPQELDFGSGMTCWRRLAEWTEAGVWPRLPEAFLTKLRSANALDSAMTTVRRASLSRVESVLSTSRASGW